MVKDYIKFREMLCAEEVVRANLQDEKNQLSDERDIYKEELITAKLNASSIPRFIIGGAIIGATAMAPFDLLGYMNVAEKNLSEIISTYPKEIAAYLMWCAIDIFWLVVFIKDAKEKIPIAKDSLKENNWKAIIKKLNKRINEIDDEYRYSLRNSEILKEMVENSKNLIQHELLEEYVEYKMNESLDPNYLKYVDMILEYNERARQQEEQDNEYLRKLYRKN